MTADEKTIRGLLHDVLIDTAKRAEAILDEVQGEPVAPAVGALVADLNANWLLFDSLGGHDGATSRAKGDSDA